MNQSIADAGSAAVQQVAAWVPPLARFGYAAKGVVYGLVGAIAVKAAMASGNAEGTTEALASLRGESGGRLVLLLIAAGLVGHVIWRVVQALLDPEHPGHRDPKRVGMRLFYLISAVIYGSLAATAWQLSRGVHPDTGDTHVIWVARLLEKPFGTFLIMIAGLAVMGYGLHQLWKGWQGDVNKRMQTSPETSRGVRMLGRIGTAARGLVLLPIGWFVFTAGRHYRAEEVVDTGDVLKMIEHGGLLAAVGLGLLAYRPAPDRQSGLPSYPAAAIAHRAEAVSALKPRRRPPNHEPDLSESRCFQRHLPPAWASTPLSVPAAPALPPSPPA